MNETSDERPKVTGTRAALVLLARLARNAVWLVSALVLFLPAPSGVPEANRAQVRGVWSSFGDLARALGRLLPERAGPPDDSSVFDWVGGGDKVIHFALFFALAFFWASARALHRRLERRGQAIVLVSLTLYAALGEVAQTLMGRVAEPGDVLANLVGAVFGLALVIAARWLIKRLR